MSYPARTLTRSREHRMIAGVVGGMADYLGMSPGLLRVIYVIGSIASAAFPGTLVYLLLWAVLPKAPPRGPWRTERSAAPAGGAGWEFDPSLDLPDR